MKNKEAMKRKIELYQKCHQALRELSEYRQIPFIEKEIKNRLLQDGAIRMNALDAAMTSKGDELFQSNYYLELAEKTAKEERERELRECDSLMNQMAVAKAEEQNKINRQMLLYQKIIIFISGIAALGTIISLIKGCN